MAETTDLQRLVVSLEANYKKYENSMKRASGIATAETAKIGQSFTSMNRDIQGQTSNLAAQFQDIAVQLQGGQSPFTVALQQGTQIGAVLGPAGAAGAVRALGSAFLSVLSPVNLATIGIIAGGGALLNYVLKGQGDVKTLDDAIKTHTDAIKEIKDAYGEAVKGIDDYGKKSEAVLGTVLAGSTATLSKKLAEDSKALFAELVKFRGGLKVEVNDAGLRQLSQVTIPEVIAKYASLSPAIEEAAMAFQRGEFDAKRFREAIAEASRIDPANKALSELSATVIGMLNPLVDAQDRVRGLGGQMAITQSQTSGAGAALRDFNAALERMGQIGLPNLDDRGKLRKELQDAMGKAAGFEERQAALKNYDDALVRVIEREKEAAAARAPRAASPRAAPAAETPTRDRYADTVAYLELEVEKAGLVGEAKDAILAKEREIQMLRRAGVVTLSEEGQNIIRLVQLEASREAAAKKVAEAQRAINSAAGYAGNELVGALDGMITRGQQLDDVLQDIIKSLIRAALQAALLGQGPLAGLMGTSGANGAIGGAIGALLPGRASGGSVSAGRAYKVGERGMETFVPGVNGVIVPNKAVPAGGGAGGLKVVVNNTNADNNRVGVQERQDSSGMKMIEIMVEGIMTQSATKNGGFAKAMQMQYGLRRGAGKVR